MNVPAGENGIRYVFAVSSNRKHNSNKVSVDNLHSGSMGHVTKHKKLRALKVSGEVKRDTNDDAELTVISATEDDLAVGDALDNPNATDGGPISKKRRSQVTSENNTLKPKLILSNDHLVVHSDAGSSYNNAQSTDDDDDDDNDDDDSEYVPLDNYHTKCVSEETVERRPGKYKVFRDEWLDIDIFRDWLDRDPTNPRKARCVACNTTMNAGKSELEKHAAGARHERALENMHQAMLQQLAVAELEAGAEQEVEGEDDSSNDTRQLHTVSLGSTQPVVMEQALNPAESITIQEQQLDAINRVATAVETLSNNVSTLVERMTSQQSELIDVLRALQKKVCSED